MKTIEVHLTHYHVSLVESLVASGRYLDTDEVLRAALRLVEDAEAGVAARIKARYKEVP